MTASRAALTRDSLRVKIAVQRVRLGGAEYRVIRPATPMRNGALYKNGSGYDMYVDRADGRRMGALWLLAARSPHSLVHLPIRTTRTAPGTAWYDDQSVDLVLVPRAMQLRPSRWKEIRRQINAGSTPREVRTACVPERDVPDLDAEYVIPDDPKKAERHLLRQHEYAETLLLTSCPEGFREGAREILAVTKDGPPRAAESLYISGACNYHVCRGLYAWADIYDHDWEQLHVEFCPTWVR